MVMYQHNLPVKWYFFSLSLFFQHLILLPFNALHCVRAIAMLRLYYRREVHLMMAAALPLHFLHTLRSAISPSAAAVEACLKEHAAGCRLQAGPSMSILSGNQFLCPVAAKCPHFLCLVHCPLYRAEE